MILDRTTQSARIVLGEAHTTSACQIYASYAELAAPSTFDPHNSLVNSNGVTPVTIVPAPSAAGLRRDIREVRLFNADTVTHTVTLQIFDGSTAWVIAPAKVSVPANGAFVYTPEAGISVVTPTPTPTSIAVVDGNGTTITGVTTLTLAGPTVTGSTPNATATLVPRGYIDGLQLTVASTTSFTASAGQATSSDGTTVMNLASAITKLTGGTWVAGNNQNGLDTGSIANSTSYHVYLIFNPTSLVTDVIFSTNATAPSLPSGFTKSRRIFSMRTGASTAPLLTIIQNGDRFDFIAPINQVNAVSPGVTTAQTVTVPTPLGIVTEAILEVALADGTTNNSALWVSSLAQTDTTVVTATGTVTIAIAAAGVTAFVSADGLRIETNASSQIRYRLSATTGTVWISTTGYIDRRGQQ